MPPSPDVLGAAADLQERRRTPVVARLVTLALLAAAAAVVVIATGQTTGAPRTTVAANTTPSVVLPDIAPTLVNVLGAERVGDAILLRVDPVGTGGPQRLVVSPGARVPGSSLQAFLTAAADRRSPMHRSRFELRYDANGAITSVTLR